MKPNIGNIDKIVRFIIAAIVIVLFVTNIIEGTLAYILLAFAGMLVVTSFVSFCGLYTFFGINTCKANKKE